MLKEIELGENRDQGRPAEQVGIALQQASAASKPSFCKFGWCPKKCRQTKKGCAVENAECVAVRLTHS